MSFSLLKLDVSQSCANAFGQRQTNEVAQRLVEASVEFHVEPMPDDTWQFTVKNEATEILFGAIRETDE